MNSFAASGPARLTLALLSCLALAPVGCASRADDDGTSDEESELRRKKRDASAEAATARDAAVASEGDDAAAPSPVTSSLLGGWTLDEKVAAKGVGTTTQNRQPTWQCKTYTTDHLPCGGWVSLETASDGHVRANVGVMGHSDFWDNVTGTSASNPNPPFPPLASNPFWNAFGTADLDAQGHGHIDFVQRDQWNQVSRRASVDVTVGGGAALVTYESALYPGSCNHYEETCTFNVLAH